MCVAPQTAVPASPAVPLPVRAFSPRHLRAGAAVALFVSPGMFFAQNPPDPPPPSCPDSGLVAWYPFDGDARDASGNGNHGVVHGLRPTAGRTGSPASALLFLSPESDVTIPPGSDFTFSDSRAVTISFWFRYGPQANSGGFAFGMGKGGSICRHFGFETGVQGAVAGAWGFASECRIDVFGRVGGISNRWHHLLASVDDEYMSLFVDGVLVDRRAVYDMKWDSPFMENPRLRRYSDAVTPQGMAVDDLRIHRRVLTAEEALALYLRGINGEEE